MEDGKEVGDVVVGKLGSEMEELNGEVEEEQPVDGVKSDLEVHESGDSDEKIRQRAETNEADNDNAGDGTKDSEDAEQVKEVASGTVEVNVNGNEEVQLKGPQSGEVPQLEGPQTDEVPQLKGPQTDKVPELEGSDVKEEVKRTELSNAGEEVQKLVAYDGKEALQEETTDVNDVRELKEDNAFGEFQQLENPVVQEDTDNQDAEIQIDDVATEMTEFKSGENMENVPADPSFAVRDKDDHTECLELPVTAEHQAEAILPDDTVNGGLGAGVTISNAIVESDGDKLDVLSEVDFDTDVQPENGMNQMEWDLSNEKVDESKAHNFETPENGMNQMEWALSNEKGDESKANNFETPEKQIQQTEMENRKANEEKLNSSLYLEGDESGTEEEQVTFFREVETFFKSRGTDFKPPKFYGEPLNLLKLWRAVIRLGGYEQVTSCKLWRQIGESFNPPKTCTTVSWTFRLFYEKALLEFEKHKLRDGDLPYDNSFTEFDAETQSGGSQGLASGRVMRDSAARAMQGWHSQRALSNGDIGDPVIKDKSLSSTQKHEKHIKSTDFASLKRKTAYPIEQPSKLARSKSSRPQMEISVVDAGEPANWVKINVRKTKDCFEIYALVPGLMREEVRVQSDPAGRLVISGEPQQLDNPWGVTPFKKVVSLPSRIDPHQTSAVVTLHGQLFVRVPFEQLDG